MPGHPSSRPASVIGRDGYELGLHESPLAGVSADDEARRRSSALRKFKKLVLVLSPPKTAPPFLDPFLRHLESARRPGEGQRPPTFRRSSPPDSSQATGRDFAADWLESTQRPHLGSYQSRRGSRSRLRRQPCEKAAE